LFPVELNHKRPTLQVARKRPGQVKCNIEGHKDPQNQALYFYKLVPPRKIELPPAFKTEPSSAQLLF
jgi:hypothetical protein